MTDTCPTCGQSIPIDESRFGGRLRKAIAIESNRRGIEHEQTRQGLADMLEYDTTRGLTRWEKAETGPRDTRIIEVMSSYLGVPPGWLLWGVEEPRLFGPEVGTGTESVDESSTLIGVAYPKPDSPDVDPEGFSGEDLVGEDLTDYTVPDWPDADDESPDPIATAAAKKSNPFRDYAAERGIDV